MPVRPFSLCKLVFISFIAILATNVQSQTRLPAIIGSNMVLQQDEMVPIWGWDEPGTKIWITTSWGNITSMGECNSEGKWKALVRTPLTGYGPHTIKIQGSEEIILENILMG